MKIGLYKTLDVDHSATPEEIKKAFYKLAHLYHPDKTKGDDRMFKFINDAYQILSHPSKKQQHDIQLGLIGQPHFIIINYGFGGTGTTSTQTGY